MNRKALYEIPRKPNGTLTAATGRLIGAFRASAVDRDRCHASEMTFFWRCIPNDGLEDLMWRISVSGTPAASERVLRRLL